MNFSNIIRIQNGKSDRKAKMLYTLENLTNVYATKFCKRILKTTNSPLHF